MINFHFQKIMKRVLELIEELTNADECMQVCKFAEQRADYCFMQEAKKFVQDLAVKNPTWKDVLDTYRWAGKHFDLGQFDLGPDMGLVKLLRHHDGKDVYFLYDSHNLRITLLGWTKRGSILAKDKEEEKLFNFCNLFLL
jgi:hypothetical protein